MSERLIEKLQNRASYCSAKGQEHCTDLMERSADLLARLVGMKERAESEIEHGVCFICTGPIGGHNPDCWLRDLLALIAEVDR